MDKMTGPTVSAIITTHNRKKLLKKAIDSVMNQTYSNIECVVVDDASDDGTKESIEEFINRGKIKYLYIDKNETKGGNYARNKGILNSDGDYIAFLDDDDEWLPTKIEKQIILAEKSNAGLVYCGRICERNFDKESWWQENILNTDKFPEGDISKEVLVRVITVTSTMMVQRSLLRETGLFDINLFAWQEYEFSLRILQRTKAAVVRENLVLYRILQKDKERISNNVDKWEKSVEYIEVLHKDLFEELDYIDKCRRRFYKYIDGFSRARAAGSKKKVVRYASRILFSPSMLYIAICKKLYGKGITIMSRRL